MTPEQFVRRCPQLWHVGAEGSWDSIRVNGFLTAEQVIHHADIGHSTRHALLTRPRPSSVTLKVQGWSFVLRDQGPLLKRRDLEPILQVGMTTADWIHLLNRRVYFFGQQAHMVKLRDKYLVRDHCVEVITISTQRLIERVGARLELAAQNTGAIARTRERYKTWETFQPLHQFPDQRPQEVTVVDGLRDVTPIVSVERLRLDPSSLARRHRDMLHGKSEYPVGVGG